MKMITYLQEYVKNSMREKRKRTWMTEQAAIEEIGCKDRTLVELRLSGKLEWK